LKRLTIITLQFYRLLVLYNIAFSILAMAIFTFDSASINAGSFLFAKLIGFIAAISLHYYSAKQTYFYFLNTGYSMWRIYLYAFAIDILVYLILITSSTVLYHAYIKS
jgi:hypothetical protein